VKNDKYFISWISSADFNNLITTLTPSIPIYFFNLQLDWKLCYIMIDLIQLYSSLVPAYTSNCVDNIS